MKVALKELMLEKLRCDIAETENYPKCPSTATVRISLQCTTQTTPTIARSSHQISLAETANWYT